MEYFEFEKPKKKKIKKRIITILACIVSLVIGCVGGYIIGKSNPNSIITNNDLLNEVYSLIDRSFLDTTKSEYDLEERALAGLVYGLSDVYSSYMSVEETDELNYSIDGSIEGIGVSFVGTYYGALITEVFKNSPADQVGLIDGDLITHVEGTSIQGYSTDKIRNAILGKKDTSVSLKVLRNGLTINFDVVRGSVETSVGYEIRNNIGYIRLSTFGTNTASLLEEALNYFKNQSVSKICIDLRGNGGGYITAVEGVLNLFVEKDVKLFDVVYSDNETTSISASKGNKYIFEEGYILVNGSSASASEVMTSALSEILGYKIIGQNTYGKGTVQTQYSLSNGSTLKLTVAKWLTSKGKWINEVGIAPDYEVIDTNLNFSIVELPQSYKYDQVSQDITNLQNILNVLGYDVDRTDGYFSLKTVNALKAFEKDYGLEVNGIYESQDLKYLISCISYYIYQSDDLMFNKVIELANK